MDCGIVLAGRSPAFQARAGEMAQVDVCLSLGQQVCPTPVLYAGKVVDKQTQLPVPDAWVTLRNGPHICRCKTMRDGRFEITLPRHWSASSVQICKEGYASRYIGLHLFTQQSDVFYIC